MFISCHQGASTVTALDADFGLIARVKTPPQPHVCAFDTKRELLYVTITYRDGWYDEHGDRGEEIVVIDPATWTITRVIDISPYAGPHDLSVQGDELHVVCESHGGCLLTLNLDTFEPIGHIPIDVPGPHWLAATATKAYTGNKEVPFVSVLDLVERRPLKRIPTQTGSEDLELSADGSILYASDRHAPLLFVIDTETDTKIRDVTLPANPHNVHVLDTGLVVVSHFRQWEYDKPQAGSVSVADPESGEIVVESIEVGAAPLGVASDADHVYVNANSTMSVIDRNTWKVETVVEMDAGAHELVLL
ncbi:YncE family protein [Amycolatopsis sp. NPDC058986]|uniref:YncE family protein n=1 Tax=unclassified Amycolatopsis TaxID=2618356 RepID=UPI003670ABD4